MENVKNKFELDKLNSDNKDKLIVLKFYADWCNPCKVMTNVINGLSDNYDDVIFVECNVDEAATDFLDEYKVKSIPHFVLFRDGFQVNKVSGSMPSSEFSKIIDESLNR